MTVHRIFLGFAMAFALIVGSSAGAQQTTISMEVNYSNWGWDAYVQANGLITVATVPQIGARTMQYDLGDHPSIFVNPAELGKVYDLSQNAQWHNYGGFKNWPSPQGPWGWPPPPTLDFGIYQAVVLSDGPDSSSLKVTSPLETYPKWKMTGLQFERVLTVYRGSSRVHVEQTLTNHGTQTATWGVWDITQVVTQHGSERDWGSFWVYFPIRPDSKFGAKGYTVFSGASGAAGQQWKANIAPGVSAVQYGNQTGKIGADQDQGWVAYVDERDGYTYAKKYTIFPGQTYPDQGSMVEVYTNGGTPAYVEVEVMGPVVGLAPGGGAYTFTEDWFAAKVNGPILQVNEAGAVRAPLAAVPDSLDGRPSGIRLAGTYGVFYSGTAGLRYRDAAGSVLGTQDAGPVSPLETLDLAVKMRPPVGTVRVELVVSPSVGAPMTLDALSVPMVTSVEDEGVAGGEADGSVPVAAAPGGFSLSQGFPNPFNSRTLFRFDTPASGRVNLSVYDARGVVVARLVDAVLNAGSHRAYWDGTSRDGARLASGVYVCDLRLGDGMRQTRRVVLLR